MALTKLPKNAFGTGSVDDSKIEDGTIQNQEISGTIPADKLNSTQDLSSKTITLPNTSVTNDMLSGSIASAKLSNSTITINGTSISLGGSSSVGVDVNWQSVQTTGFTAVAGNGYFVDTTSGAITVTLPASASLDDQIAIKDYAGTFASNNLTIGRNGHNIQGVANDSLISTNRASLVLVYVDSTKGWLYAEESNVADLQGPAFTSATGGTITTSGDFKIHTFTGDGCFVVNTLGNGPTYSGGPSNVDYLVVAGGGAGGAGPRSGGGGAGGYRTTFPSPGCNAGAFPISATTYPITVGGGGSSVTANSAGTSGSNSIFSTITSSGGGGGGGTSSPGKGVSGGSGGGSGTGSGNVQPGGSGNTPPVSPSQGNPGGANNFSGPFSAGGGGGAGASGGPAPIPGSPTQGGPGGNGLANSITGSSVTRAGGGGGGGSGSPGPGTGGSGGGGAGGDTTGTPGTANTGGGGGGTQSSPTDNSGSGGKGIVIIRYKFQ